VLNKTKGEKMEKDEQKVETSTNDSGNDFDIVGYIKEGFNIVKSNPVPFIVGNLILLIINGVAMGLLVGPWYAGMYYMVQKARKSETIVIGDAFWGFNNFIPLFVAGLIFSIGVGIGTMFCLVPGFIIGAILLYVIPLVAFQNAQLSDAINMSKEEAMKSLVNHTLFFFLASLIGCIGFILCGVGVVITLPVGIAALAVAYEERLGK
jgi:uncharacterized membrane protein